MSDQHEERKTLTELAQEKLERESLARNGKAIALGEEAKIFLTSHLARSITDIADARVGAALNELKGADPEDTKKIRELQNEIKLFESFDSFLADIVAAGQLAYQNYQNDVGADDLDYEED